GLPQAVQVVHRQAQLPVHTLTLTPDEDALSQVNRLSDPGRLRMDLHRHRYYWPTSLATRTRNVGYWR
ncbi:amino acid adenylation, partial [Pseudomonas syringae pv. japonica str. M301072]